MITDGEKYNLSTPKPLNAVDMVIKDSVNISFKVSIKGAYEEILKLVDEYCLSYTLSKDEEELVDDEESNVFENYSAKIDMVINDLFKPQDVSKYFTSITKLINTKYKE